MRVHHPLGRSMIFHSDVEELDLTESRSGESEEYAHSPDYSWSFSSEDYGETSPLPSSDQETSEDGANMEEEEG